MFDSLSFNNPFWTGSFPQNENVWSANSSPFSQTFANIFTNEFSNPFMQSCETVFNLPRINFADNTPKSTRKNYVKKPLSNACRSEITKMAKELNFNPQALIGVIYSESGGNPQAVNPHGGATGLIQFMPKTAVGLGTTTTALARMNAEQQLVYVKKYIENAKRSAGYSKSDKLSSGELYALIFMPAKAKKGVLCNVGTKAYSQNKGLDLNRDGIITTKELGDRIA